MPKPKLNYFSPLPPVRSGISDYSEELLKELEKYFEITKVTKDNYQPGIYKSMTIHNIGNNKEHTYSFNELEKNPSIIILHDWILQGMTFGMASEYWSRPKFIKEVLNNHGFKAIVDYFQLLFTKAYKKSNNIERDNFQAQGFHKVEEEKGRKFRWTRKKSKLIINEQEIKSISMEISTDFPAKIILDLNGRKKKIKLAKNEFKKVCLENIPSKKLICKIKVSKPLSIITKLSDSNLRTMGVKIHSIKYQKDKEINIPFFEETFYIKNLKFERVKNKILYKYPLNKKVIKSAKAIITHSNHLKNKASKINPKIPMQVMLQGVELNKPKISKKEIRGKLGIDQFEFIACSFGKIQKHKHLEKALEAFKEFLKTAPNSIYIIMGEEDETIDIRKIIRKLGLEKNAILTGYIPFNKVIDYIYASNACINLRWPTTGATSGSLMKALSTGTPCIISDLPENKEFPTSCVFKIKRDKNETENILGALNKLKNEEFQKEMSNNAIEHIKKNHLWQDKAKELRDFILKVYNENSNNQSIG